MALTNDTVKNLRMCLNHNMLKRRKEHNYSAWYYFSYLDQLGQDGENGFNSYVYFNHTKLSDYKSFNRFSAFPRLVPSNVENRCRARAK